MITSTLQWDKLTLSTLKQVDLASKLGVFIALRDCCKENAYIPKGQGNSSLGEIPKIGRPPREVNNKNTYCDLAFSGLSLLLLLAASCSFPSMLDVI